MKKSIKKIIIGEKRFEIVLVVNKIKILQINFKIKHLVFQEF